MDKLILLFLLACTPALAGQVYKCIGADGKASFSNSPYCQQNQAYAEAREEKLIKANINTLASNPASVTMEMYFDEVDLPTVLEYIGDVAGITVAPINLDDVTLSIQQPPISWYELFGLLVNKHNLDYRMAYNKLYIYSFGSMGQTIVHNPDMLRWYQTEDTWKVVQQQDAILASSNNYRDTEFSERLPALLRRVREELGEQAHPNAAEFVVVKEQSSSGIAGSIGSGLSTQDLDRADKQAREKMLIERRRSRSEDGSAQRDQRCFSSIKAATSQCSQ